MPTVLRTGPYRLFFYSGDGHEPQHVHVERSDSVAKFWLNPVRFAVSRGFSSKELGIIKGIIDEEATALREAWNEYFGG